VKSGPKFDTKNLFSIHQFGGRNFAGARQGATPETDSDYAEC